MYEQYTDKQIVEMLIPKLRQAVPELNWNEYLKRPDDFSIWNRLITVIYKSGYIRGQLGRSFIIGENKDKKSVSPFKAGDKVKFLGLSEDETLVGSQFYPPVNTVGEVVEVLSPEFCFVQWPKGAVYSNGALSCPNRFLEKVTEHWVPATKDNVKRWNKVRYLNAEKHEQNPDVYPLQGTIGEVISVVDDNTYLVQWPDYTTAWFANQSDLEVLLRE